MKTMMILALILLVAVGVWNSPPRVEGVVYVTVSDLEPYMDESGDITIDTETLVPMAEYTEGRVKTADEIAKKQAETGYGADYPWEPVGNRLAATPTFDWRSSPDAIVPDDPCEPTRDEPQRSDELEVTKSEDVDIPGMSIQDWKTPRSATEPNCDSPQTSEPSLWLQGLSTKISPNGDRHD